MLRASALPERSGLLPMAAHFDARAVGTDDEGSAAFDAIADAGAKADVIQHDDSLTATGARKC
jgi:hypothetical protein